MALSDACHGFLKPCGADVKVGCIDYNTLDSQAKQDVHKAKVG